MVTDNSAAPVLAKDSRKLKIRIVMPFLRALGTTTTSLVTRAERERAM